MTGKPTAESRGRPGPQELIARHGLVAAPDYAAGKRVTIISASADSGKASPLQPGPTSRARTAGSQSPEFGDGLSPAWWRGWIRREGSHGR